MRIISENTFIIQIWAHNETEEQNAALIKSMGCQNIRKEACGKGKGAALLLARGPPLY